MINVEDPDDKVSVTTFWIKSAITWTNLVKEDIKAGYAELSAGDARRAVHAYFHACDPDRFYEPLCEPMMPTTYDRASSVLK